MRSVLFSAAAERAAGLARVLGDAGYDPEVRAPPAPGSAIDVACSIAFLDLAMGEPIVRRLAAQLAASNAMVPPLVAIIGEPSAAHVDGLIEAGVNMYFSDDLATLALRVRFLRGAIAARGKFAELAKALRGSDERYRTVISAMEEGLFVRGRDGMLSHINPSAARMLGLSSEEVAAGQRSAPRHISRDGTDLRDDDLPSMRVLRTGAPVLGCEIGICRRDGTVCWVLANAHPILDPTTGELMAAVTTITDMTERRRLEHEVRLLLERAPDAVLVHRDDRVVWTNSKWVELLGYSDPREYVGKHIMSFVAPSYRERVGERLRLRDAGIEQPPFEYPVLRRDGSELQCLIISMPTLFEGEPAYVGFVRDLTEQREIEMQLMAADRLASLGRLAASVGHEINNPLTYVMGNMQLAAQRLRQGAISTDELLELLDEAVEGADRVRRIAADLKVFAKSQNESSGITNVHSVVESCVRMTSAESRHRARVILDIGEVPLVEANEARIAQVISNLVLNAAQAIPEGRSDAHTITIAAYATSDHHVAIRVTDTGVGIAPEHLPHVFEPFFTTKDDRGGTGLGLSVCNMLIASQGGTITVESELGKGTSVTVRLRAASEAMPPPRPTPVPAPRRRRVLIVDDEIRIAELLREHLEPHDVTLASSGRDALGRIAECEPFDVIVCDLMMADLGGIDVYEQLSVSHPGLEQRIVFITGGAFTPRATQFLLDIRNPCLEKPFEIPQLMAAIEVAAKRAGSRRERPRSG